MKQLIDFIPLIIFFAVYKFANIYVATGALMAATVIQIIALQVLYKKIEKGNWITLILVLIFGAMTLFFHNDMFIKWKVTVLYAAFGLALWISLFMKKPLMKQFLGKEMQLPESVWNKVTFFWGLFFWIIGAINIYVAFYLPTETWVDFKVFGVFGLMLLCVIATGAYIYRYLPHNQEQDK
jgi:intracellular septation protein